MHTIKTIFSAVLLLQFFNASGQWSTINMPEAVQEVSTVTIDDNILFIGGAYSGVSRSSTMKVYNVTSGSWWTIDMPDGTKGPTCLVRDRKIYVGVWSSMKINVYDFDNDTWDVLEPPIRVAKMEQMDSLLIVGNSGDMAIYNFNNSTWTNYDGPWRSGDTFTANNGKIVFAGGGGTDEVRIFDVATESWTESQLSIARDDLQSISHEGKMYFIGGEGDGFDWVGRIDIYDTNTDTWAIDSLSRDRNRFGLTKYKNKIYITGGQVISFSNQFRREVDILDTRTGIWEKEELPTGRAYASPIGYGDKMYIAGGTTGGPNTDIIEILELEPSSAAALESKSLSIYPNPVHDVLFIDTPDNVQQLHILDASGRIVLSVKEDSVVKSIDVSALTKGVYYIRDYDKTELIKFIKL